MRLYQYPAHGERRSAYVHMDTDALADPRRPARVARRTYRRARKMGLWRGEARVYAIGEVLCTYGPVRLLVAAL